MFDNAINDTIADIEANRDSHVERLCEWLRIPSISTDPDRRDDLLQAANWVHALLCDCGIPAEIIETPGHPCVIGDTGEGSGDGPTVLIYGHYDVQPTGDESLWNSPPFEPTITNGSIVARGSADDKGQVLTHLLAAESWMKTTGKTPVRVKFLIEGEEEVGSPNLEGVVRAHKDKLACDYVAISDTAKFAADMPAITYGTKGLVYKEITVTGPRQDLHSGSFGGTLNNPGNALAVIIASLRDGDNRITIPGFYDNVRAVSAEEKAKFAELPFDETEYAEMIGVPALTGEKGYSTLERRWVRPTLDVNGLFGGFTGDGASTIVPAKAMAKVSMRIVPDQDPQEIGDAFDAAVRSATPDGVDVEIKTFASCAAYVSPIDSPGMSAAARAVAAGFGRKPCFIREGGSLPILPLFKEVLGADSLMMGFCVPNCNAHGPNEFFQLSDLHDGTKAAAHFLAELAR